MNEIEYLKKRICEIEHNLYERGQSENFRKNQAHALLIYKLDLERAVAKAKSIKKSP